MRILLRSLLALAIVCLAIGVLRAADDPFVGKWKVNPSKSKIIDEMKFEGVGENKYAITFVPGSVPNTIVADGTDQPSPDGTTVSVTVGGPNNWTFVRKKEGRKIISAIWTLSADGETLDDDFTQYQAGGSPTTVHLTYQRTAGNSGLPGTWDSESSGGLDFELEIQPYEGDGLTLISPLVGGSQNIKFDGKDKQRVNQRSLELSNKSQGQTRETKFEVSTDLKTLTVRTGLGEKAQTILVFDRE
jgi:hypothetical protein